MAGQIKLGDDVQTQTPKDLHLHHLYGVVVKRMDHGVMVLLERAATPTFFALNEVTAISKV